MNLPNLPALSINQPWAWLIAAGLKDIENRDWNTSFRGAFLIHAGLKVDKDSVEDLENDQHPVTGRHLVMPERPNLLTGGIVGIAELVDVITLDSGGRDNPWFVGRYGFVLRNARPVELTPCKGALGFFRPDYTQTYKPKPAPTPRTPKAAPPEPDDLFAFSNPEIEGQQ